MIGSTNSIWDINIKLYEQLVNYTMLYDFGNECSEISGGWSGFNNGNSNNTTTKKSDHIHHVNGSATGPTNSWFGGVKNNKDVSSVGYAKYFVVATSNKGSSSYSHGIEAWGAGLNIVNTTFTTGRQFKTFNITSPSSGTITFSCRNSNFLLYAVGLLKTDDWQTLSEKAGITATSIDEILSNSILLLSNRGAVEFMIKQCTGDFMGSAVQSSTFLTALNNSKYKTIIMANEHWAKFLNMVV